MALNVLVVDDSAVMRTMIIKTLGMAAVPVGEVHQAANGQEGLDALKEHWIDLGIVDINMPVMDGEEMIQRMQADPNVADTPVIVVSTEGSETRINRLVQIGAKFIHKPFAPETLRDIVAEITGVTDSEQPA